MRRLNNDIDAAIEEFWDKVSYNRFQINKQKVEQGIIEVIGDDEESSKPSHLTWSQTTWETAQINAKKIEEKYKGEKLLWDDFEWGMINGKLSALNWVRGEEWDMLDT
jgi:hypothetical protein